MRPLSQFPLFRSHNIDEAHQLVAQHVKPHRIQVVDQEDSLDVHFDGVGLDGVALFHVFYGSSVSVNPEKESQSYFIQTTLAGEGRVVYQNKEITTRKDDTVVVSPTLPYHMILGENCSRVAIEIDKTRLQRCLSGVICEEINEEVMFDLHTPQSMQSWSATVNYILQQASLNPTLFQNPNIKKTYSDLILSNLLEIQPHNYTHKMHTEGELMLPTHLRCAIEFIQDSIVNPPSVVELAQQCNVAVRTLQRSFVRCLQMTPAEYIRTQRLEAVHRALLKSDSAEKGVLTRILLDHGVADMGRFASYYRKRFGCTPSQTLS